MKNSHKIALIFTLLIIVNINSQEKLKGNKEVKTENRDISDFNKIEVIDDLDVELVFKEKQSVSVETDSNLQSSVITEVINGTLSIKLNNKIVRKKELIVYIGVNEKLRGIDSYNNSNIKSKISILIDTLSINAFDNSDVDLKLNSKQVKINSKKNSDLDLEISTNSISILAEESSEIKGTIEASETQINLMDRSSLNISGSTNNLEIETLDNSTFKGKDYKAKTAILNATNSSNAYINSQKTIEIFAKNSSAVYLYGTPIIKLTEFFDKATLYKK
ncbi:GIN domain-containing protein [Lutibacter citreus]|uniref:GIN domain-containing protein n=1 Tax=Lutibacter citreus TaxID=2138210 RepID=UPI000DBE8C35|nr:DUF2807 domain-containing protein [Lutibacter citreus]